MRINNVIAFNILSDWKKKEVEPLVRQRFILDYLAQEKISLRELGRRLNVSHSTLQDWTSLRQLKKGNGRKGEILKVSPSIYMLADRLTYLLTSKDLVLDDRMKNKLSGLKNEIIRLQL